MGHKKERRPPFTIERAQDWQKDPTRLTREKVSYWSEVGIMMTAMMPLSTAQELVRKGECFIIHEGAIGRYEVPRQ